MLALAIILLVLVLILLTPIGADVSFISGELRVCAKIWCFRLTLIPARPRRPKREKPKKQKKHRPGDAGKKPKPKLGKEDIIEIVRLGLETLGALRRRLSIDRFMLHLTVGADDPFDAVKSYGGINAAIGAALPLLHRAFNVKSEDIGTQIDFASEKMCADVQLIATFRIGQLLYIGICAAIGFIKWRGRCKKRAAAAQPDETKG